MYDVSDVSDIVAIVTTGGDGWRWVAIVALGGDSGGGW
jgi:hypothetical protein